jgi:hypothetical protein
MSLVWRYSTTGTGEFATEKAPYLAGRTKKGQQEAGGSMKTTDWSYLNEETETADSPYCTFRVLFKPLPH